MRFRKKPVVIEARVWDPIGNPTDVTDWLSEHGCAFRLSGFGVDTLLIIPTLEGDMITQSADWVIRGIAGEFYPCKPLIFVDSYEVVEDAD